jgi:hypothetical protein
MTKLFAEVWIFETGSLPFHQTVTKQKKSTTNFDQSASLRVIQKNAGYAKVGYSGIPGFGRTYVAMTN